MNNLASHLISLVSGGCLGLLLGAFLFWLFRDRVKSRQLENLRIELVERQKDLEASAEKLQWLETAEEKLREAFEALASRSLQTNADDLLKRSKSELEHLVGPLGKSLDTLDDRIRELEQKREGAYQGLQENLRQLSEAQIMLQETTTTLSEALRSSTTRGHWGELQLRRVVELAGMTEHVDFEEQSTVGTARPDMIVNLPNSGIIPVDAKAPMKAYLDAMAADEDKTRNAQLDAHVKAVRGRVRELGRKQYWNQFSQNPQFVVMFIPNEACLSLAFQRDGELLDYALKNHILIASPVTLLALLKAVGYGWQQVNVTENARRIAEEGKTLYQRISKLYEHLDRLGGNLKQSVDAYNDTIGSLEGRLLPSVRRFEELGIETVALSEPQLVDRTIRTLAEPEIAEQADQQG